MGLMTEQGWPSDEYEAVALPPAPGAPDTLGSAVFLRRSARPSRRAVLHLHDLTGSFAPADLVRWYNERGFHFYVTDLDVREPLDASARWRSAKSLRACFAALDGACRHMRETDGIDAIILSAQESAAASAAMWCADRGASGLVDALILSSPDFGKALRRRLDIACPVLVISASGAPGAGRRGRHGRESVRLGQHVTWLHLDEGPAADPGPMPAAGTAAPPGPDTTAQRRRLFDEMGRWLGAYMYGQVRDKLL